MAISRSHGSLEERKWSMGQLLGRDVYRCIHSRGVAQELSSSSRALFQEMRARRKCQQPSAKCQTNVKSQGKRKKRIASQATPTRIGRFARKPTAARGQRRREFPPRGAPHEFQRGWRDAIEGQYANKCLSLRSVCKQTDLSVENEPEPRAKKGASVFPLAPWHLTFVWHLALGTWHFHPWAAARGQRRREFPHAARRTNSSGN